MASSVLILRLFGTLEALLDDVPLLGLHLREGERLLAYLALRHGTPISYRQLAQQFWPSEAQQNDEYEGGDYPCTRQAIHSLRRALGLHAYRLASAGKGIVRLDLDGADADFITFQQLVTQEEPEAWAQALALYRAPLLEDWDETWAQEARVRNQRSYDRIAAKLNAVPAPPTPPSAPVITPTTQPTTPTPINTPPQHPSPSTTNHQPPNTQHPTPNTLFEADGGAVPLDSPFYIERPTDAAFQQAVARHDSIVLVKGARQVGKTSLLARGLQQARQAGTRVVLTDFQKLNEAQLASPDTLYLALANTIALQLELEVSPRQVWEPDFGPNMNMEIFIRRYVLRAISEPLVWGMDEIDRLFGCDYGSEVFGLFRSWHNERSLDPSSPWSRLTLAIAYATEAHLFITDMNQSPFNVGTRLTLDDFTPAQIGELNQRYGAALNAQEITRFHELVGGQPYLARRGMSELIARQWRLEQLEAEADRDEGPFGDHLRRLLTSLLRSPDLTEVVRGLLAGQPCASSESFYRLRAAGVLVGASSQDARFRCRLYASFLARHLRKD